MTEHEKFNAWLAQPIRSTGSLMHIKSGDTDSIGRALTLAAWQAAIASQSAELAVLRADADRYLSALERVTYNYRLTLAGKPVRDVSETLSECDAAMAVHKE